MYVRGLVLLGMVLLLCCPVALGDVTPFFHDSTCEGDYAGHLQGVCTDQESAIFWSFTTELVKTDRLGKILKKIPVVTHHGDLCYLEGKVYVAVNLKKFNDPEGNADSWVYVYDGDTLEFLSKHAVPEVFHGAGGIGVREDRFYLVGGLPEGVDHNYVYEYDADWTLLKTHQLESGWTHLGIQTATFHDGSWWFGCYGKPRVLLKTDVDFTLTGRYNFDSSMGIVGVGPDAFLVAEGTLTPEKRFGATLRRAYPDEDQGLVLHPSVVSALDPRITAEGAWQRSSFRFAAVAHRATQADNAALSFDFDGTGVAVRLGGHDTPAYGPVNLGGLIYTIDGGEERLLNPQAAPREVVLAEGLAPGAHHVRIAHRSFNQDKGVRIESFQHWATPLGRLQIVVNGEENSFLNDCRVVLRREGNIVRDTFDRNWLTGQCALTGVVPGDGYTLELMASGWDSETVGPFAVQAQTDTQLPPVYLKRSASATIRDVRFPRLNQPAIRLPGETFRARFLAYDGEIAGLRLVRTVGEASISRELRFTEITERAYYYDREIEATLSEEIPPGTYDLEITVLSKGQRRLCWSPRSVCVVAAYPVDIDILSFGHLDTAGQYQAAYLERMVNLANLLAPDLVLCSTASNAAYVAGALAGLDMPWLVNFGNHQLPGHEAWFGDPIGLTDYGPGFTILNYGRMWHEDRGEADLLLSSRAQVPLKIINAFEPNAPVALLDRHQIALIHDAHGPGARVQEIGLTPTVRAGKVNSESFRIIRIRNNRVRSATYDGDAEAPIPFARVAREPVSIEYRYPNDGTRSENTVTIRNTLREEFPDGRVTFLLPPGNYTSTGRIEESVTSDDGRFVVLTVRVDIPASGRLSVSVKKQEAPREASESST